MRSLTLLLVAQLLHALAWPATGADFQPQTLTLGAAAPDFKLPAVEGRDYALGDFAKAPVLCVIFTCNHCPTAQYYEERIKRIVADYQPKGLALVAISPNDPNSVRLDELGWSDLADSFEEMKTRARDRQFNFPYLFEGDKDGTARAYGPQATPHAFVFDQARKLRYVGAIDDSERPHSVTKQYSRDALDALFAGKEPPVTKTKVVGCSVKWAGKTESVQAYMQKLAKEPVTLSKIDAQGLAGLRKNDSGKFRLVNFWATWCAPCVAEFEEFVTINRMYRHRDFEMVSVSINRPEEEKPVIDFLTKKQASFRNHIFASADREPLMNAFDREWEGAVPFTVVIDPEGKVIYRESGSINSLALKRALVSAMNQRKPW